MTDFFLGIDVSKGYADFVILDNMKNIVENNFQLDDTFEGHNKLFNILSSFYSNNPSAHIFAAVESTGGYENNWLSSLQKFSKDFSLSVARLNPFGVHHSSKAELKRITTDKISAQNIAEYLINHHDKISFLIDDYFAPLRKQWIFIRLLVKQRVQLLNQLESILYSANPEILIFCKHGMPDWVLHLLQQYPTALKLSRASLNKLSRIPYITIDKAEILISNAKNSVAASDDSVSASIIQSTVAQILNTDKVISAQEKVLEKSCNLPEIDILKSFKGVGTYSAVGLLLEIGAVERFSSAKKLASFFGLNPVFKSSGDGISGIHMSKKGRREPRIILFNVARTAITFNPLIRDIYLKHISHGMTGLAALGAVMHKILRIIYGMLKHKTFFNPDIDKANREKTIMFAAKPLLIKNRRYQQFDTSAPVSKKQNKKREVQLKSQME
jgi:transposase